MKEFDDLASNIHMLGINVARKKSKLKSEACNVKKNVNAKELKSKVNESCLKLSKFELPNFYDDFNSWMSFKKYFCLILMKIQN